MVRVRLTHKLTSHLACSGGLWQKACEPIAPWLAQSFSRAAGVSPVSPMTPTGDEK